MLYIGGLFDINQSITEMTGLSFCRKCNKPVTTTYKFETPISYYEFYKAHRQPVDFFMCKECSDHMWANISPLI